VLAQIAAEALGTTYDRVKVVYADTDATPLGFGSYSSRVTLMGGNACKMAGEDVRAQMLEVASRMLEVPAGQLDVRENRVFRKKDPEKGLEWHDVAAQYFSEKGPLVGRGHYSPPEGLGGDFKGATVGTSPAFSFGSSVCEVEVDTETGQVRIVRFTDAHDSGTVINPLAFHGQVEGSIVMGVGEVLTEDVVYDDAGRILNDNLHDYLIPSIGDAPDIVSIAVPSYEPRGPYGAKEVGEGSMVPVLGSIANAIYDAIGVRITELPITPERVLKALREKRGEG